MLVRHAYAPPCRMQGFLVSLSLHIFLMLVNGASCNRPSMQGALISLALVLVGQPEARVASLRKRIDKFVGEKHEEVRVGLILPLMYVSAPASNFTTQHTAVDTWF